MFVNQMPAVSSALVNVKRAVSSIAIAMTVTYVLRTCVTSMAPAVIQSARVMMVIRARSIFAHQKTVNVPQCRNLSAMTPVVCVLLNPTVRTQALVSIRDVSARM